MCVLSVIHFRKMGACGLEILQYLWQSQLSCIALVIKYLDVNLGQVSSLDKINTQYQVCQ